MNPVNMTLYTRDMIPDGFGGFRWRWKQQKEILVTLLKKAQSQGAVKVRVDARHQVKKGERLYKGKERFEVRDDAFVEGKWGYFSIKAHDRGKDVF